MIHRMVDTPLDVLGLQSATKASEAATWLRALPAAPVPVRRGSSRTPLVKWSGSYNPNDPAVARLFSDDVNVALIAGLPSAGIVDVDHDHPYAAIFADIAYPAGPSFGRESSRRSHRLFICSEAKTAKLSAPMSAAADAGWQGPHGLCIVEIQGNNKLVTIPPSIHPSGEPYRWESGHSTIPAITREQLRHLVGIVGFMVVLAIYYPAKGRRHEACFSAGGVLARANVPISIAQELIFTAAELNNDEEAAKRGDVGDSYRRLERGEAVFGIPAFAATLGLSDDWVSTLRDFIEDKAATRPVLDSGAPRDVARAFFDSNFQGPDGIEILFHQKSFYTYSRGSWSAREQDFVAAKAYDFLETALDSSKKNSPPYNPTPQKVAAVLSAGSSLVFRERGLQSPPFWLDDRSLPHPRDIVAFSNGLLNSATRELQPATSRFFNLNCLDFGYDPNAETSPVFDTWRSQLWDDQESQDLLQEVSGYLLAQDSSQHKIFLLIGPSRAGKGVLTTLLQCMVGHGNYASPTLASLGGDFGMWPLIGKSVAFVPDARIDEWKASSALSQNLLAVSGGDSIAVNRKGLPFWEGTLGVRFVITTNEIPRLKDESGALAGRFLPIVFQKSFFGKEDPGLSAALMTERAAITNWALDGYRRLRGRGRFTLPTSSQDAIEDIRSAFSSIHAFIRDRCIIEQGSMVLFEALYDEHQRWAAGDSRVPLSRNTFSTKMGNAGFRVAQPRTQTGRPRTYLGIRINEIF